MAPGNADVLEHYLVPNLDVVARQRRLPARNSLVIDVYRVPDLVKVAALTRRVLLPEAHEH